MTLKNIYREILDSIIFVPTLRRSPPTHTVCREHVLVLKIFMLPCVLTGHESSGSAMTAHNVHNLFLKRQNLSSAMNDIAIVLQDKLSN